MFGFAHDLRSYLRTVLTRIQLVQAGGAAQLPESDQSFLKEAATAAADINGLLTSMVTYCDVSNRSETMGLRTIIRGILLEKQDELNSIEAELEIANDLDATVPRALQTVLKELFTNAVRFRLPKEQLRIALSTQLEGVSEDAGGVLEITFSDNGSGVAAADLERIFAPFQRLRPRTDYPGYGMGLAICRRIMTAYGGTIVAEAPSEGGLTLRLKLPLTPKV